jgi:hypothetical protein
MSNQSRLRALLTALLIVLGVSCADLNDPEGFCRRWALVREQWREQYGTIPNEQLLEGLSLVINEDFLGYSNEYWMSKMRLAIYEVDGREIEELARSMTNDCK